MATVTIKNWIVNKEKGGMMDHQLEAIEKALKNALRAAEKVTSVPFFPYSDSGLLITLIALQIYNTLGWEYLSKIDIPRFVPPKPPPTPSSS